MKINWKVNAILGFVLFVIVSAVSIGTIIQNEDLKQANSILISTNDLCLEKFKECSDTFEGYILKSFSVQTPCTCNCNNDTKEKTQYTIDLPKQHDSKYNLDYYCQNVFGGEYARTRLYILHNTEYQMYNSAIGKSCSLIFNDTIEDLRICWKDGMNYHCEVKL